MNVKKQKFYAVAKGHQPGVYHDYETYWAQMSGFSGAKGKKFSRYDEAMSFVQTSGHPRAAATAPTSVTAALAAIATASPQPTSSIYQMLGGADAAAQTPPANNHQLQPSGVDVAPVTAANNGKGRQEWFYAVAKGRQVGIYKTWPQCKAQVHDFPYPKFRKFRTEAEAKAFIEDFAVEPTPPTAALQAPSADVTAAAPAAPMPTANRKRPHGPDDELEESKPAAKKRVKGEMLPPPPPASDDPNAPVVYTDGACSSNGKSGARAGYGVFWGDNHADNVAAPVNGTATNNRGEFLGAVVAIRQAHTRGLKRLTLCTDSQLLINSATKWMQGWKRRGWKKGDGTPVSNIDLVKELDELLHKVQVTFRYVPGHANIYGNEMADRLAREGAKKF